MDENMQRSWLAVDYHSYAAILAEAGLDFIVYNDQQLAEMSLSDLRQVVRRMAEVARTPRH